ncbi:MAG: hypothetical protein IPJ65_37915 [Archangiaceae bacterium]|nr:hypothetical protein [Archangiaceae bacterium]
MSAPSANQVALARRLLAVEGADGGALEACAAAAEQVYAKLDGQLSPLLGSLGFRALLVRSAKLLQHQHPVFADLAVAQSAAKLRAGLRALEPATAQQAAEALFAGFFVLIATFIGERLTTQSLRGAWPEVDQWLVTEREK